MKVNKKLWLLIQRVVTGNAGQKEISQLNQWMQQDPQNEKLVREIEEIWNSTPEENFDVNVHAAWNQFKNRKQRKQRVSAYEYTPRKSHGRFTYMLRVAAVIVAALFIGLFVQFFFDDSAETDMVSDFYVMEVFETNKGDKAQITFSDGTKVILNSASSLRFPKTFNSANREVFLEGEALFEVADNPDQPFIVHIQDAEIEVLGTEFNVRGWSDDDIVEVVVRKGKVALSSANQSSVNGYTPVIVNAGYYSSLERGKMPTDARRINVTNYLLWTHGGLHFDNAPFGQVIRQLERRFNVRIYGVNEELMQVPFTGTFRYADLNEVLSVIAVSMDIGFERTDSEIFFY